MFTIPGIFVRVQNGTSAGLLEICSRMLSQQLVGFNLNHLEKNGPGEKGRYSVKGKCLAGAFHTHTHDDVLIGCQLAL